MPRLILASGCDRPYYPRMQLYMHSVQLNNRSAETYLIGVGWQPPDEFGWTGLHLPLEQAAGHGGSSWCVQHGAFLHVLPAEDDDIIVFTDGGDVTMQRDFGSSELERLMALQHGTVLVVPDTALTFKQTAQLMRRLDGNQEPLELPKHFDVDVKVYNTGVVACTAFTYRRMYELYMEFWHDVEKLFSHYARQQWLMSWVLGCFAEFRVEISRSLHVHGHAPLPSGARLWSGMVWYQDEPAVFRHHLDVPMIWPRTVKPWWRKASTGRRERRRP